ncbi:MAG: glycoside hydrolase family 88 protein [Umezawaea sp.]
MSVPTNNPHPNRRTMLLGTLAALAVPALAPGTASATAAAPTTPDGWSRAVIDSTMKRLPDGVGGWSYPNGLYLYGQYLFSLRHSGDTKYFTYLKSWVDGKIGSGHVDNSFDNLDAMRAGQLLPLLYAATGEAKYRKAAKQIRDRFPSYPRTTDGGMWHATSKTGQLWADGVYMAQPFLSLYGKHIADSAYCYEESAKNVLVYFAHLKHTNGLLFHAYDEDGSEPWASGAGHHSEFHWGRAIGWFAMTAIDLLEVLPAKHPRRQGLIDVVKHLAEGFANFQHSSGLWYQVVDRGGDAQNWLETSCSSMYTFMLSRGVQRGYLDAAYQAVAEKGYAGIIRDKVSLGADGLTSIKDISEGTNVGDLDYYYGRARRTNDNHGLGAFLVMTEQFASEQGSS